jgi:two-component system cell cycle response regulator DivK
MRVKFAKVMRDGRMPTVLVVDDNADTRVVVRWQLERWGCRVLEASDGQEAFESVVESRPDLVLMDLSMPRVDGFDAIRSIRGREEFARLPIIAVTAFDRADSRDGAKAAGCDQFLSKPIDFYRLEVLGEKLTRAARDGGV